MPAGVTLADLTRMKQDGEKIVSVVAWDYQIARIADQAEVEIVSVGDSVGINLWGHSSPFEVTMDQMLIVTQAVRRGVSRALVSADFPFGPLQAGERSAVQAAIRFVKEAGVDLVKLDGAGDYPELVTQIVRAGIPVFAQFGVTPQQALRYGLDYAALSRHGAEVPDHLTEELADEARRLESAGASLLDFTNSGPYAGPAVVEAVAIPVMGGLGGGPWLDGRIRMAHAAIGYAAQNIENPSDAYANVARTTFEALQALAEDVRAGRQIRGGLPLGSG